MKQLSNENRVGRAVGGMLALALSAAASPGAAQQRPAPGPQPPKPAPAQAAATGKATGYRATIALPRSPPTRTHCTFDIAIDKVADAAGDSVTLEWDPLQSRSLVRSATLVVPDNRQVSVVCHAEPARHAINPSVNYAWRPIGIVDSTPSATRIPKFSPNSGDQYLIFCDPTNDPLKDCNQLAVIREDAGTGTPKLEATVKAQLTISKAPDLLGSMSTNAGLTTTAARNPLGTAARSFTGLSDEALGELFQVVAEVVLEKAKSKGLKLAQDRLQQLICQDLTGDGDKILFPRTCDAVRSVRLDDLTGAGRQLLEALTQDLVLQATSFLTDCIDAQTQAIFGAGADIQPVAKDLVMLSIDLAVDAAAGKQERLRSAGQRLVVLLSRLTEAIAKDSKFSQVPMIGGKDKAVRALVMALAIVRDCQESGRCDAARIDWMMQSPGSFFSLDANIKQEDLVDALRAWPEVRSFISTALRVLRPPPDTTDSDQLRAGLGLVFDVMDLFAGKASGSSSAAAYATTSGDDLDAPKGLGQQLRLLRELLDAAVERDLARASTVGVRLVAIGVSATKRPALKRFAGLAAAAGAFLATYTSGREPSKEELAARREARKTAISSLIDAQTERRHRLGDTVFSVGSSLGFMGGYQFENRIRAQLNLTLGLSVDWHSKTGLGLHFEVAPFNLASYLALSENTQAGDKSGAIATPSPGDALSPSLTLGLSHVIQSADLVVFGGVTAGYAAKIGDNADKDENAAAVKAYSGYYMGGTLGMYIPIFDFN